MEEYGNVEYDVSLINFNTYKIGGKAKYIIKPINVEKLKELILYLKYKNINYFVLGKGSNVIIPDEDYEGVVILLDNINNVSIKENVVEAEAGIILSVFINKLINNNLGGLENLIGIPGTLGGAVVGNAGCYGSLISDYLLEITYIENNEIKTINKENCKFEYRNSIFKQDKEKIIISVKFGLPNSNKEQMLEKVKANMIKRNQSQPLEYPNAGSVFRNPENLSAGKIIEDMGFKNYNVNGAYISDKHANFIINKDNATSEDIKTLIEIVKNKVKEEFDIELILEQEIIKY